MFKDERNARGMRFLAHVRRIHRSSTWPPLLHIPTIHRSGMHCSRARRNATRCRSGGSMRERQCPAMLSRAPTNIATTQIVPPFGIHRYPRPGTAGPPLSDNIVTNVSRMHYFSAAHHRPCLMPSRRADGLTRNRHQALSTCSSCLAPIETSVLLETGEQVRSRFHRKRAYHSSTSLG